MKRTLVLPVVLSVLACGHGNSTDVLLAPPSASEGLQLGMDVTAPPGTEVWKCRIAPLPIKETIAVHAAHSLQTASVHHFDISILTSGNPMEPGVYNCADLYANNPRLMESTTLYGSQAAEQKLTFPDGVAALVPAGLVAMYELHYVNATQQEHKVESRLNVYTMPIDQVTQNVWGGAVRNQALRIPPNSVDHVEWAHCAMTKDIDLMFVSMHTHKLGIRSTISLFDGTNVGEQIYENRDWASPKIKDLTSAPIHIAAGQGFEFACHYRNPGDTEVDYGLFAKDEMCNMALGYTPGDSSIRCKFIETSDGRKIIEGSGLGE